MSGEVDPRRLEQFLDLLTKALEDEGALEATAEAIAEHARRRRKVLKVPMNPRLRGLIMKAQALAEEQVENLKQLADLILTPLEGDDGPIARLIKQSYENFVAIVTGRGLAPPEGEGRCPKCRGPALKVEYWSYCENRKKEMYRCPKCGDVFAP